jgi:hypothetical protein
LSSSLTNQFPRIHRADNTQQTTPDGGLVGGVAINFGDFVTLTNGVVTQAASYSAAVASGTRVALFASASVTSSSTAGTPCQIEKLTEDCILSLPMTNAGSAPGGWSEATYEGNQYGLYRSSSLTGGIYSVNYADTTNKSVEIIGIDPNTPSTDTYYYVLVKVLAAYRLA